jgi:YedE family putative selenium metabolism protein
MPALMAGLLLLAVFQPQFSEGGPIFSSARGPGAMHAALAISLGAGLVIGFLAQRTRFCTMGSIRDIILMKDMHLISGVGSLIVVAFIVNLILGQVNFGFAAQPVSHSSHLWNFLGMVLAGMAFALAGGCPGRQLFLSGEGDGDAAIFVLGMVTGAAFAHNFSLAGKPDSLVDGVLTVGGISSYGQIAVILGIVVCLVIGLTMREK